MRIALVVTGGVDRSGVERVTPILLWLVERLARRHDVHVFALHHDAVPSSHRWLGATVHDTGRVEGQPGLRRRTAAEQMERVHRRVQDTRERAGENIMRQQAASERVRAAVTGRRRR